MSFSIGVERTPQHLHVLYGHAKDSEFVQLARGAHRDDAAQFHDVGVHLVSATLLNLTVVLSAKWCKLNRIHLIVF